MFHHGVVLLHLVNLYRGPPSRFASLLATNVKIAIENVQFVYHMESNT